MQYGTLSEELRLFTVSVTLYSSLDYERPTVDCMPSLARPWPTLRGHNYCMETLTDRECTWDTL